MFNPAFFVLRWRIMTKRKFNLFLLPIFCFFSKRTYREVAKEWTGLNLAYLFLLLSACCLIPTFMLGPRLKEFFSSNSTHLIEQLPDLQIRNGRIIHNQKRPLPIQNEAGTSIAYIDTSGSMNYIYEPQAYALLTRSKLLLRYGPGEEHIYTYELDNIENLDISREMLRDRANKITEIFIPIVYGSTLFISFLFVSLLSLIASLIGSAISSSRKMHLGFPALLRISAAALTPSIIHFTAALALGVLLSPLLYPVFILLYLMIGINACDLPGNDTAGENVDLLASLN